MTQITILSLLTAFGTALYLMYTILLVIKYGPPNGGLCLLYYMTKKRGRSKIYCTLMSIIPLFVVPSYVYISLSMFHSLALAVISMLALLCASLMFAFPNYRDSHTHNVLAIISRLLFLVWAIMTHNPVIISIPIFSILTVITVKELRKKRHVSLKLNFLADVICYLSFMLTPLVIFFCV